MRLDNTFKIASIIDKRNPANQNSDARRIVTVENAFLTLSGVLLTLFLWFEIRTSAPMISKDKFCKFCRRAKNFLSKNLALAVTIAGVLILFPIYVAQAMITSHTLFCTETYCAVHHCPTVLALRPIGYGPIDVRAGEGLVRQKLFPLSNIRVIRDCSDGADKSYKWTMYCPDCRLAESLWEKHLPKSFYSSKSRRDVQRK
jgi:hypothetical protein